MAIRKRKWKNKKGDGQAWQYDYYDQEGKRQHKQFRTKSDAEKYRKDTELRISQGTYVSDRDSITISEAAEEWISSAEQDKLETTTIIAYKNIVKYSINPFIGHLKLNRFSTSDVMEFRKDLMKTPYPDDFPIEKYRGQPRSDDILKRAMMALGAIFGDAIWNKKVAHNPVTALPRRKRGNGSAREKLKKRLQVGVHIPTNVEIMLIVEHVKGWYANLIVTAIFTGLRASELRGLRWSDVDLEKGLLHVRQRADRFCKIGAPKSLAGFRTVPLSPRVISVLCEWREICPKSPLDLVFPSKKGTVAHYGNIRRASVFPTMRAAGLMVDNGERDANGNPILEPKYTGLHAFRHWYASWCINRVEDGGLGFAAKKVQQRMGHSSIQMTMDIYGHLFPAENETEELAKGEAALLRQQKRNKSDQKKRKDVSSH